MNNERIILEMLDRIKVLEEEVKYLITNSNSSDYLKNPRVNTSNIRRTSGIKDSTKYIFNGARYCKSRLVLAVVKEYVKQNPNITSYELERIFDYTLQGNKNHGVIKRKEDAIKNWDYEKRFFVDEEIKLKDGIILVSTQWGIPNINNFISRAEQLNFNIKKINI